MRPAGRHLPHPSGKADPRCGRPARRVVCERSVRATGGDASVRANLDVRGIRPRDTRAGRCSAGSGRGLPDRVRPQPARRDPGVPQRVSAPRHAASGRTAARQSDHQVPLSWLGLRHGRVPALHPALGRLPPASPGGFRPGSSRAPADTLRAMARLAVRQRRRKGACVRGVFGAVRSLFRRVRSRESGARAPRTVRARGQLEDHRRELHGIPARAVGARTPGRVRSVSGSLHDSGWTLLRHDYRYRPAGDVVTARTAAPCGGLGHRAPLEEPRTVPQFQAGDRSGSYLQRDRVFRWRGVNPAALGFLFLRRSGGARREIRVLTQ